MRLREGDRVRLLPFEDEGEEYGTVLTPPTGYVEDVVGVQIDKEYRNGPHDDGIREVPWGQLQATGSR